MKKQVLIFIIFILSFVFFSCEENFEPFTEKKDTYILNCLLRNDTTFQALYVSHSYQPNGFNPYTISTDPVVRNADVRVWINDSVYIFRDTIVLRTDTSRYKEDIYFYYHNNLRIYPNSDLEVEVILPWGKKLSAKSIAPPNVTFSSLSTSGIAETGDDYIRVLWSAPSTNSYFLPRLIFSYYKPVNGINKMFTKTVPLRYIPSDGTVKTIYPLAGYSPSLMIHKSVLRRTLEENSENDTNKKSYFVNEFLYVDVLSFDINLTRYYSSTQQKDNLSISVDENDYSNIVGGQGVFASYSKSRYRMKFISTYITSLGYSFNYGE